MDFRPQIDIFWTFNRLHFCWRDFLWFCRNILAEETSTPAWFDSLQSTYQSWLRTTHRFCMLLYDRTPYPNWRSLRKLWKLRNSFSEGLFRIANLLILLKSLLDSLPVSLVGMNFNLMCQYIGFVADRLLLPLRCRQREKCPNTLEEDF